MLYRVFLALLAVSLVAHASLFSNQHNSDSSKHALLAHRVASNVSHVPLKKRCKPREKASLLSTTRPSETPPKAKLAPVVAAPVKAPSAIVHHTATSSKPASQVPKTNPNSSPVSGLLRVTSPICGSSGATSTLFLNLPAQISVSGTQERSQSALDLMEINVF